MSIFFFVKVCLITSVLLPWDNVEGAVISDVEKVELKEKVLEMFDHAYGAYKKYAHPADELMPLSCRGRYRGSEANRGDIDEALGNFSLTLIDTLDTLVVLGHLDEFEDEVKYVIKHVTFNTDVVVSVFETNIRILGGLLGAHSMAITLKKNGQAMKWYNDELLSKATDIADRLLAAFNTSTGIPYPKVNLRYGIHHRKSRVGQESHTCTACAGTMIMEFGALSRLTGNPIYEEKAHKAMEALWKYRSRHSDLVGTTINIHNGDWTRRDSGVGAGIDSYYEYCLKAYILLGDESYRDKFNKHYAAIKKYVHQGYMLVDVFMHQPDRTAKYFVDALQAFWPGLQVLKGDLKPAIETHEMLYNVAKKFKFLPEAFTTNFDVHWAQHPLRPEFIESTYFLYQATKDPYYLSVGKHVIDTLEDHARVKCGFAAFQDLRTLKHDDKMDSFVLAETFKYLYLLFSEESEHVINIHDFVFTTEAHLLPLYLSVAPSSPLLYPRANDTAKSQLKVIPVFRQSLTVEVTDDDHDDHSKSCPNPNLHKNLRSFAEMIRRQVNSGRKNGFRSSSCVSKGTDGGERIFNDQLMTEKFLSNIKIDVKDRPRRLLASELSPSNMDHMNILKEFGIEIQKEEDGKIHLLHQSANAKSTADANEGILFMHEMVQLAKERGVSETVNKPRSIQLISAPFNGNIEFRGGYSQFGKDFDDSTVVQGQLVETIPYRACQDIENAAEIAGRIALVERGDCMFIDKARLVQRLGGIGVIIVDHHVGSSEKDGAPFGMSGDTNDNDIHIAAIFLFRKEGEQLRLHMQTSKEPLRVNMLAKSRDEIKPQSTSTPVTASSNSATPSDNEESESTEFASNLAEELFTSTETNSLITPAGRKITTTIKEYIGPNRQGNMKKFYRSHIETCSNLKCENPELATATIEEEYFERPKQTVYAAVGGSKTAKITVAETVLGLAAENVPPGHDTAGNAERVKSKQSFKSSKGVMGGFSKDNIIIEDQDDPTEILNKLDFIYSTAEEQMNGFENFKFDFDFQRKDTVSDHSSGVISDLERLKDVIKEKEEWAKALLRSSKLARGVDAESNEKDTSTKNSELADDAHQNDGNARKENLREHYVDLNSNSAQSELSRDKDIDRTQESRSDDKISTSNAPHKNNKLKQDL